MSLLSTVYAGALEVAITPTGDGVAGVGGLTVEGLITFVITAILVLAGVIFFFMLLLGGIRWILSGGDKAATESARGQITSALVGLVIVFSAWAIVTLIEGLFPNVNILNFQLNEIGSSAG